MEEKTRASVARGADLDQLTDKGYCVCENVLSADLLQRLQPAAERALSAHAYDPEPTNQGRISAMPYSESAFVDLMAWPGALDILHRLGFAEPRFWSGFVIAKERGEPPLYWHQDWVFWDEPEATAPLPHQLFIMYYLTDTSVENGCLRLIPRSHRQRLPLHDQLGEGHESDIRTRTDHDHPAFAPHPDEVAVPVRAGDAVLGDARLLHSAHRNQTPHRRTVLTLWYLPRYADMSARLRAGYCGRLRPERLEGLDAATLERLRPLMPACDQTVEPAAWNRVPGAGRPSHSA